MTYWKRFQLYIDILARKIGVQLKSNLNLFTRLSFSKCYSNSVIQFSLFVQILLLVYIEKNQFIERRKGGNYSIFFTVKFTFYSELTDWIFDILIDQSFHVLNIYLHLSAVDAKSVSQSGPKVLQYIWSQIRRQILGYIVYNIKYVEKYFYFCPLLQWFFLQWDICQ